MTSVDVRKEFGAAVRAHRLRLGLSQENLAERAELHRTYVTDVERGAGNLSLEVIARVARALKISIGALFNTAKANEATEPGMVSAIDILLVEDDVKDVELTLKAFGHARLTNRMDVVGDGESALDYLQARKLFAYRKGQPPPQVILLDLHLPKLDGLEVLQTLRSNEATREVHVIVLSHSQQDAHVREAMRLGANAYIVKPVDFHNFSAVTPHLNFHWTLLR